MTTSRKPTAEHRFFLCDPDGEGVMYYASRDERDAAAKTIATDCADQDGDVAFVSCGEVTHVISDACCVVGI